MHKIICFSGFFFFKKKCVCLPYLKFSDLLPETLIFLFGLALDGQLPRIPGAENNFTGLIFVLDFAAIKTQKLVTLD